MDVVPSLMFQGFCFEFGHSQEVLLPFLAGSYLGTFHTNCKQSRWLYVVLTSERLRAFPTGVEMKAFLNLYWVRLPDLSRS